MFIHYNLYDILEFFENEPILISDTETGEFIYVYEYNSFKLILSISVYEKNIDLNISFRENTVISQKFRNVTNIKKINMNELKIYTDNHIEICLTKEPQIGAIITNAW